MSELFDPARWRPAPFLPERETRDGTLVFVVAVLCFLACVTALGVIATDRAARGWANQLSGEATVIVRPQPGETPDSAAARAAETLAAVNGVTEVRALEPEKAFALVDRPIEWRGHGIEEVGVDRNRGTILVSIDQRYFRPTEVDLLIGDPSKARSKLGWTHTCSFEELVRDMVFSDLERVRFEGNRRQRDG